MERTTVRLSAVLLLLLAGASSAVAFSTGPPASRTNARGIGIYPVEPNCTQCHTGNALNDPNGKVEILDVPVRYDLGHTYTLRVRTSYSLADTTGASNPLWGFELTAIKASDGTGAGTLVLPNPGAGPGFPDSLLIKTVSAGTYATSGRQYIEHSVFATRTDHPSPSEWSFQWVAPNSPGRVYFFAAGNAANGNSSSSGDHIFTSSDSTDAYDIAMPGSSPWSLAFLVVLLVGAGVLITRRRTA